MSNILHADSANIFVGDADPSSSLFLVIKNVKLPDLEETVKEHTGGGAVASVELGMGVIKALSPTFKLEGFRPEEIDPFLTPNGRLKYTIRYNIRDIRNHGSVGVKAVVEGRMTKIAMNDFDRDKGMETDYEIKETMFYTLHYGEQEKFYFDYFAGPSGIRVNGVNPFQGMARNLGLA